MLRQDVTRVAAASNMTAYNHAAPHSAAQTVLDNTSCSDNCVLVTVLLVLLPIQQQQPGTSLADNIPVLHPMLC
jgi:hypothetical protein